MAKQPKRYVDETAPDDPGAPSLNEEPRDALDFDEHRDERSGRAGDLRNPEDVRREFPPHREREAGRSGGEVPRDGATADDFAPETLLDENRSHDPATSADRIAADTDLRDAAEEEIGEGLGADEAELARRRTDRNP